ncbi:MAG: biotin transporter BioY [bacterium]|nr:biotin transporter BioY [bacterium]MCM1409774.1 biotin transporter BioY [Lachnospiraceae bacterium]
MKTKKIALIGLMTAVICLLGPLAFPLPFSPVPISLGVLGILLAVYLLGMKWGTVSCLAYLLLGLAGMPVFTGFSGGVGKVLGPTGGYLLGYIFLSLIAGFFIHCWPARWPLHLVGMTLGTAAMYLFGTLWLGHLLNRSFIEALWIGVIPYIPADLFKIALTLMLGIPIRRQLGKAGLLN